MLQYLATFRRMSELHGTETWRTQADTRLSEATVEHYPERIGIALWGEKKVWEEGRAFLVFVAGAMCHEAMPCTSSPAVSEILSKAYLWGCGATENQSWLANKKDDFGAAWDEVPLAHYMEHESKALMLAQCVCDFAAHLQNEPERLHHGYFKYGAMFRFHNETLQAWRLFQHRIATGELVYCQTGTVAWNSGFKKSIFGNKEISLNTIRQELTTEMISTLIAMLRLHIWADEDIWWKRLS